MIGAAILLAYAAGQYEIPTSKTCPDGKVMLTTDTCPAPAKKPRPHTCPDGSNVAAADACDLRFEAQMECVARSVPVDSARLWFGPKAFEVGFADGRRFSGTPQVADGGLASDLAENATGERMALRLVVPPVDGVLTVFLDTREYGCMNV